MWVLGYGNGVENQTNVLALMKFTFCSNKQGIIPRCMLESGKY